MASICANMARSVDCNMLLVLEASQGITEYLDQLNSGASGTWYYSRGLCRRVTVYTRFHDSFCAPLSEGDRFTARQVSLPGLQPVTFVGLHLGSKLHQKSESQAVGSSEIMHEIRSVEERLGHTRTFLVGDFNMNPYEAGMIGSTGFHALSSKSTTRNIYREVEGKKYRFFFNPMWGKFGDGAATAYGTYRYLKSEHVCQEWHIFDQVLLRPSIMDWLEPNSVRVLTTAGTVPLVSKRGNPRISDHLPLCFNLEIPEGS